MDKRGHESPMDFQWEGSGPVDPSSPFRMSGLGKNLFDAQDKRNNFRPTTPNLPPLTPTASQSFNYGSPNRPTPSVSVFGASSFSTPQQQPETPTKKPSIFRTPSKRSDIFTPFSVRDTPVKENGDAAPEANRASPITKGLQSKSLVLSSPTRITGRGELKRGRPHDGSIFKARRRRLRFDRNFWTSGADDDGDDDDDADDGGDENDDEDMNTPRRWGKKARSAASQWVETHRDIPLIASHYLQLFFNLSLISLLLYALFCFYLTIRRDVDQKVEEYSAEIIQEMNMCAKEYIGNRCDPAMRVPAMEVRCMAWEKCMNRDPSQVGRAKVSAETFAEILNSFIEPISYKTMFFCLLVIFGGLIVSNLAFGFFRAKTLNHPTPYAAAAMPSAAEHHWGMHQQPGYHSIPSTPLPATPVRLMGYQSVGRTPGTPRGPRWE